MIWLLLILAVCVLVGAAGVWWCVFKSETLAAFMTAFMAGVGALVIVILIAVAEIGSRVDATRCTRYAVEAERDTRFVRWHYMSWDCLVPTDDGWVGIDQIRKVEQ